MWSHHEKMVIVDNFVGFMGGIDLCYGRMDNSKHLIVEEIQEGVPEFWPYLDYYNPRIQDYFDVK